MLFFLAILGAVVALVSWSQARRVGSPTAPLALLVAAGLALVALSQAVVVVPAGHVASPASTSSTRSRASPGCRSRRRR